MNIPAFALPAVALCVGIGPWIDGSSIDGAPGVDTDLGPVPAPVTYTVDSAHSSVVFRIKRDVAFYFGRFDHIEGEIQLDKETDEMSVEIRIKAESAYTGNERRDNHLRSPDFFDVKQFPWITFKSTQVTKAEDDIYDIDGELEIHGVKKEIQVSVQKTGEQTRRGSRIGFEISIELKRSDYGMEYGRGLLGDDVTITMGVAAQAGGGRGRGRGK